MTAVFRLVCFPQPTAACCSQNWGVPSLLSWLGAFTLLTFHLVSPVPSVGVTVPGCLLALGKVAMGPTPRRRWWLAQAPDCDLAWLAPVQRVGFPPYDRTPPVATGAVRKKILVILRVSGVFSTPVVAWSSSAAFAAPPCTALTCLCSTLAVEAALPVALVAVALARAAVLLLLAGLVLKAAAAAHFPPLLLPPYLGQYCLLPRLLLLQLLEPLLLRPQGMSPPRHPLPTVLTSTPTHLPHQRCPAVRVVLHAGQFLPSLTHGGARSSNHSGCYVPHLAGAGGCLPG